MKYEALLLDKHFFWFVKKRNVFGGIWEKSKMDRCVCMGVCVCVCVWRRNRERDTKRQTGRERGERKRVMITFHIKLPNAYCV